MLPYNESDFYHKSNKNKSSMPYSNQEQSKPKYNSQRNYQNNYSEFTDDLNQNFGFSSINKNSNYQRSNLNNRNKNEFHDYEFDLINNKRSNHNTDFIVRNNKYQKDNFFKNFNNEKNLIKQNKYFENRKNIEDDLVEIKLPFESFGNQRRSVQIEKNYYSNQKNFNIQSHTQENQETKVNYRLQKKIKKGEVDDEIEIINSYANENTRFLPIEEYGILL